jgi:CheY-like chemotaxis protein
MPGLTGIEVCATLQADPAAPRTALLLLTAFDDDVLRRDAEAAGASGYLGKGRSQREVCRAIEQAGRARGGSPPDATG